VADFTIRFGDFKGGSYGIRDPAKADSDTWSGTNIYPYDSGLLGVRAGTKLLPVTGLSTHPVVPGPLGFWSHPNGTLVVFLNKPYVIPQAGGAAQTWAAYPDNPAPASPVHFINGAGFTYSLCTGRLYKYVNASTTTLISTPAPLSHVVRWGYYFVGVDANVPWRIWFSTVDATGAHYDTWGANDYLDIGGSDQITALNPIFNILYVGKRSGWSAVSGVLGTLASVRGLALGNGPVDPRLTTVTTDNRIMYWSLDSRPTWFNGERVYIDSSQDVGTRSTPFTGDTVIVTPTSRRLFLANDTAAGTEVLSWASSAWSRHVFPSKLGGLVPGNVIDGTGLPPDVVYAVIAPVTVGDPVRIGSYNHSLDRPGHTNDQYAAPIDVGGSDLIAGELSLPSYWEPIGRQVRVRSMIVQFRKWASGVAGARNEIQVRLDAHGAYGSGPNQGEVAHWDEPCERSSTSGSDDSWRVNVGAQGYGNGFQVHFPKLVGVALREVIVLCDARTERL
jgi:hypothetical protein